MSFAYQLNSDQISPAHIQESINPWNMPIIHARLMQLHNRRNKKKWNAKKKKNSN